MAVERRRRHCFGTIVALKGSVTKGGNDKNSSRETPMTNLSEAALAMETFEMSIEDLNPQWLRIRNAELEGTNKLLTTEMTELRRIERSLETENSTYGELDRSGLMGILLATSEGILIDANDAFLKMIGYSSEYTAKEKISWKQICTANEVLTMCERDGNYVPRETQFIQKDGTHIGLVFGAHRMASRAAQIIGFAVLVNQPRGKS
jgi:PAS domain-containing protein